MHRQRRILTLDGGGVRGLSSLLILRKLLCLINIELTGNDLPVPAKDVFDLIAGTSTGGLIALMIVKLGMTIDECIAEYQILARHIFQHQNLIGRLMGGFGKSRCSGDHLASKIRALIKSKGLEEGLIMSETPDGDGNRKKLETICSVVCRELGGDWTWTRAHDPVLICSDFCHADYEKTHLICTVCDAARATSAAPTYFPEVRLFDKVLVDGAYGNTNNPSYAVFGHFADWMRITSRHPRPMMMVNIGTGTSKGQTAVSAGRLLWRYVLPKALLDFWHVTRDLSTMVTQCKETGKLMREIETLNPLFQYWRFSEDESLHDVALDDWKSVEDESLVTATEKYLEKPEVLVELRRTARALALHSRAHRYAQRDKTVRIDIPSTSSKSSSQQTCEGGSSDKVKVFANLPHGNGSADAGDTQKPILGLQLRDGIQLDDLEQPVVAKVDVNGEPKRIETTTASGARRRQSSGPGELFHSARAELQRSMSRREDGGSWEEVGRERS